MEKTKTRRSYKDSLFRMEVKDVILTEFDEELHNKTILQEGKQDWTQSALIC